MKWNAIIRYFLRTFVYTSSTPCRDVKFCPNIPLGDLSWNSLTEVMWLHHIKSFSNSKIWKKLTRKRSPRNGNEWSGSFVLLCGWNKEDVRGIFSIQIYWEVMNNFEFRDKPRKLRLLTSQRIWIEKNPTVHLPYFIHRVRQTCRTNHFPFLDKGFLLLALPQHQHTSFLCPDVSDRIALSFFKELLNKGTLMKSSRLRNEKTERNQKQSTIWKNDKIVR